MGRRKWKPLEITALVAVLLGFVLELAPLLLLSIAPLAPLASAVPISVGNMMVPSNQVVGAVLIVGGAWLYWNERKQHRRGS